MIASAGAHFPAGLLETGRPGPDLASIMTPAVCDVTLVAAGKPSAGGVVLPFAGHEHDWAALKRGAWLGAARPPRPAPRRHGAAASAHALHLVGRARLSGPVSRRALDYSGESD